MLGLFSEGLINSGNFAFQNGLDLKNSNSNNSQWAYNREGLLSEEYLRLRFGELISGSLIFGELVVILYCIWSANSGNKFCFV